MDVELRVACEHQLPSSEAEDGICLTSAKLQVPMGEKVDS